MKLDETDKHWRIREADTVDFAQIQTNKEQSRPEKLNKTWRARRNQDQTASWRNRYSFGVLTAWVLLFCGMSGFWLI